MQLVGKAFEAIGFSLLFTTAILAPVIGVVVFLMRVEKNREDQAPQVRTVSSSPTTRTETGRGRVPSPSTTSSGRSNVVPRLEMPYWKDQGWSERNGDLVGRFKTKYGTWKGKFENFNGNNPKLYIFDPPSELNSHPHGNCFMPRKGEKFFVHFNPPGPGDVGTAIQKVEQILEESFAR